MDEILKNLRKEYKRIEGKQQEINLQFFITTNIFLKSFGYDIDNFELGKRIVKGFCDIYVLNYSQ